MTIKIHMLADVIGRALSLLMKGGQVGEITAARTLPEMQEGRSIVADKAYESNALRAINADSRSRSLPIF